MANPYSAAGSASTALASARGDMGNKNNSESQLVVDSYSSKDILIWLLRAMAAHSISLTIGFVAQTVAVILQLYVPILIGNAIDVMVNKSAGVLSSSLPVTTISSPLLTILTRMAIVIIASAFLQWISGYCTNRVAVETARDMRERCFAKCMRLPLSFIDTHAHGDLVTRIISDVEAVSDGLLQGMTQLLNGAVTISATLIFMMSLSWQVALVVVLLTPLSAIASSLIAKHSSSSFAQQQALQGSLGAYAEEMLGNISLLHLFGKEEQTVQTYVAMNKDLQLVGERAQFISSLSNPSTRLINNLIYAVVASIGCLAVIGVWPSALSVGQVQSFLAYANQYMKPINEIAAVVTQVQTAFASARRVCALLDAKEQTPDIEASSKAVVQQESTSFAGALKFEHVFFSYDKKQPLLKDICLDIPAGSRFALVGPTGCGKTTLINLLMRFYELDSGSIYLDGTDISTISRHELRSAFGMVLQDSWLFEGSVRENIAYGMSEASDEAVVEAAKKAHADSFIQQLPQGYDTMLSSDGTTLSQGQMQLLCIARAMLANPCVLLLDEATSSIDTRTELRVQDAFDRMMEGRTSLVVAHRLSTIKQADCIVVLGDGAIQEMGTHEELLAAEGRYYHLYMSQFADQEE